MGALRFGITNYVELCTLTSTPDPVTELDNLKTEWRARQTRFNDFSASTIVIEGELDAPIHSEFMAIMGSNLATGATVQFELFATDVSTTDLLNIDPIAVMRPKPIAVWRAGIDGYNVDDTPTMGNIVIHWFDAPILWQRFKVTIEHGYDTTTPVANSTVRQDETTGIVSLEAESGTVVDVGANVWTATADGTASDDVTMLRSGASFYHSADAGPSISYTFTASATGAHSLWARIKTGSGANSWYTTFDGSNKTHLHAINAAWHWVELRTVTLTAETDHTLRVSARDYAFNLDKLVIQPPGSADPTGEGPAASGFGTVGSEENVSIRMLMIGDKLQMRTNFSHGATTSFLTDPDLKETASGYHVPGKLQNQARKMTLPLNRLDEGDKIALADMEIRLMGKPFLISAYPDAPEWIEEAHTMLGNFSHKLDYTTRTAGFHRSQITIFEV